MNIEAFLKSKKPVRHNTTTTKIKNTTGKIKFQKI